MAHKYNAKDVDNFSTINLARGNQALARKIANLCTRLDAVTEGDRTLLDNTLIVWKSKLGNPALHVNSPLRYTLIGGAREGTMKMGQYLDFSISRSDGKTESDALNKLLTSLANTFDIPVD